MANMKTKRHQREDSLSGAIAWAFSEGFLLHKLFTFEAAAVSDHCAHMVPYITHVRALSIEYRRSYENRHREAN